MKNHFVDSWRNRIEPKQTSSVIEQNVKILCFLNAFTNQFDQSVDILYHINNWCFSRCSFRPNTGDSVDISRSTSVFSMVFKSDGLVSSDGHSSLFFSHRSNLVFDWLNFCFSAYWKIYWGLKSSLLAMIWSTIRNVR